MMTRGVAVRARDWMRPWRRTTLIGPLLDALDLRAVVRAIEPRAADARVLGPDEFSPYLRILTPFSPQGHLPNDLSFDFVVLRQTWLSGLDPGLLRVLRARYACLLENRRFALFTAMAGARRASAMDERIDALLAGAEVSAREPSLMRHLDRAILVTTFERPAALARSLRQIVALGCPTLVVDDGSARLLTERNRRICEELGATFLPLPENRGLAAAMSIGLDYLLADRRLHWISYFQDDVDVAPETMDRLMAVEDAADRPLATGYDADEHPPAGTGEIAGVAVSFKRSSPAVHLHAHADYWRRVMPIPSEYLGAPKPRWQASLEDYWIVNNAPSSVGAQDKMLVCVPGLVRTFLWHHADSTWANPNLPDPPLGPPPAGVR